MKVKTKNYPFINISYVHIRQIDCTPKNITKLIDVLTLKKNIEIVADMGFVDEESISFEKIDNFKLEFNAYFEKNKYSNGLLRSIVQSDEYKNFLDSVFEFDVEYIIVYDFKDISLFGKCISYDSCEGFINQNKINLFITVVIPNNEIVITFNKRIFNTKQIVAKIKKTFKC